jgi:hypothetical protein
MSDAAPPTPPNPAHAVKHVGKGVKGALTGHSKWIYIAGATVLVGVAYLVWRNGRNTPPASNTVDAPAVDTSGFYPDSTQGAFGGYSDPGYGDNSLPVLPDPALTSMDPLPTTPVVINMGYPMPTTDAANVDPVATSLVASTPTGGGTQPKRTVAAHRITAAQARAEATRNRGLFATATKADDPKGVVTAMPKGNTAPPGFPHKGPHGWYRNEYDSKKKKHFHLYQSGKKVYL